jgi:hypothetical protein
MAKPRDAGQSQSGRPRVRGDDGGAQERAVFAEHVGLRDDLVEIFRRHAEHVGGEDAIAEFRPVIRAPLGKIGQAVARVHHEIAALGLWPVNPCQLDMQSKRNDQLLRPLSFCKACSISGRFAVSETKSNKARQRLVAQLEPDRPRPSAPRPGRYFSIST